MHVWGSLQNFINCNFSKMVIFFAYLGMFFSQMGGGGSTRNPYLQKSTLCHIWNPSAPLEGTWSHPMKNKQYHRGRLELGLSEGIISLLNPLHVFNGCLSDWGYRPRDTQKFDGVDYKAHPSYTYTSLIIHYSNTPRHILFHAGFLLWVTLCITLSRWAAQHAAVWWKELITVWIMSTICYYYKGQ